ncbi:MAG: hypothetical protein FWK04_09980 [Nostoc sp. GBBB01]|nr:hypothetical protein [Nostoc sp. GBBB01]
MERSHCHAGLHCLNHRADYRSGYIAYDWNIAIKGKGQRGKGKGQRGKGKRKIPPFPFNLSPFPQSQFPTP